MTKNVLKILGVVATIGGVVATLVSNYVGEQTRHQEIKEEVDKAVSERLNNFEQIDTVIVDENEEESEEEL